MILNSFFSLLLLFNSALPTAESVKESIDWRARRTLTWNDFKAAPLESAPNAALTSTSILINYRYGDSSFSYHLQCVFYPEKSWTKVKSSRILAHEQGHFDISQLFTRRLHKALSAYKVKPTQVDKDVMAIYQKLAEDQAAYQKQYDIETNYSRDLNGQQNWNERISRELDESDAYAAYPQ